MELTQVLLLSLENGTVTAISEGYWENSALDDLSESTKHVADLRVLAPSAPVAPHGASHSPFLLHFPAATTCRAAASFSGDEHLVCLLSLFSNWCCTAVCLISPPEESPDQAVLRLEPTVKKPDFLFNCSQPSEPAFHGSASSACLAQWFPLQRS